MSESGDSFTPASVREILEGVLANKRISYKLPTEGQLNGMAEALNFLQDDYVRAKSEANKKRQQKHALVQFAFKILDSFFAERAEACQTESRDEVVAEERDLQAEYRRFCSKMEAHKFHLDIDTYIEPSTGDGWHHVAEYAAATFRVFMEHKNPDQKFGGSDTGPVAKFAHAIVTRITGETPTIPNVGHHLRHPYQKKERDR